MNVHSYIPSRAAVTSFVKRAITRQAASCWYRAWDNSTKEKNYEVIKIEIYIYIYKIKDEIEDELITDLGEQFVIVVLE